MSDLILFTDNYPFGDGETFLETEISYLAETFTDIHIFPLFYGNSRIARDLPSNVSFSKPAITFNVKKDKITLLLTGTLNTSPIKFSLLEFLAKKVYRNSKWLNNWLLSTLFIRILLKPNNFNPIQNKINSKTILYFYWGDKYSGIVPFIAKKYANNIIARFHGSDLYEETKGEYISFRKLLLNNLSWSVFISQKGREYLINKYPSVAKKDKLFRLGVHTYGLAQKSNDNVLRIVSCSNVIPLKRIDIIIDALYHLSFLVEWTHFGDGVLMNTMKEKSETLKSNIQCNFVGRVSNSEILKFYMNSPVDLFLNVSTSEGIPVSIMEAISFGIPVFATDVGGTSEVVCEEFGVLLPENVKAKHLAEEIARFRNESEEAIHEKRLNAHKFWEDNYNANTNYKAFTNFLRGLID